MAVRVPLGDGRVLEFPDGTSPEVIDAAKARYLSEAPAPAASAGAPKANPTDLAAVGRKALTSIPGRAAAGVALDRVYPIGELIARTLNATGLASDEYLKSVQGKAASHEAEYDAARAEAGQSGLDIPRIAGPVAFDIATTRSAMPAKLNNPQNLLDLGKSGAVVGAASGTMSPVKKSADMSNTEYFLQKSLQGGMGAGIGAGIAPLAAPLAEGVAKLASKGASAVKSMVSPNAAQRVARSPEELEAFLAAEAKSVGIDFAALPEELRASLRDAAARAMKSTGQMPAAAVRNRLTAEAEGLPPLTVGQSTRDPAQFSREANLADEEFRTFLGGQQVAATAKLKEAQAAVPGEATPYTAGKVVIDDIAAQRKVYDDKIKELYETARNDKAGYMVIQNTRQFAKDTIQELKKQQLWNDVPKSFQDQLKVLTIDNGRFKLSARQGADLLKNINAQRSSSGQEPIDVAMGVIKSNARKLLDEAELRDPVAGARVLDAFKSASTERAKRGAWEDTSTAVKTMSTPGGKAPSIAPERVYERYVASGSVDDFQGLWATLSDKSKETMQRQFVNDLAGRALNKTGTELTNYSSAIKWLREFPPEKLKTMFPNEAALTKFKNILEYVRLTKEAPPGNFVNRSNSGVMLMDALASSRNLPLVGPAVTKPLANLRDQVAAAKARGPDLDAPGEALEALPIGALERFGRQSAPYIVPGALGVLGQ